VCVCVCVCVCVTVGATQRPQLLRVACVATTVSHTNVCQLLSNRQKYKPVTVGHMGKKKIPVNYCQIGKNNVIGEGEETPKGGVRIGSVGDVVGEGD